MKLEYERPDSETHMGLLSTDIDNPLRLDLEDEVGRNNQHLTR